MYAGATTVREKARDSARIQQVRQIDAAVNLYTITYSRTPSFGGTCSADSDVTDGDIGRCVARSTAPTNTAEGDAWNNFLAEISQFIPISEVNSDPCGLSGCESQSGGTTGYVYVAPAAMEEFCASSSCGYTGSFDDTYQLSAALENTTPFIEYASFTTIFEPPTGEPSEPPTIGLAGGTTSFTQGAILDILVNNTTPTNNTVTFTPSSGSPISVVVNGGPSTTHLNIPLNIPDGSYTVTVTTVNGTSNALGLTVTPSPFSSSQGPVIFSLNHPYDEVSQIYTIQGGPITVEGYHFFNPNGLIAIELYPIGSGETFSVNVSVPTQDPPYGLPLEAPIAPSLQGLYTLRVVNDIGASNLVTVDIQ